MSKHRRFVYSVREMYDAIVAFQGGGCAICGARAKTRRLNLDHDHSSMTLRGALCHRCNRGLPTWATPEWLRVAADYLEAPPAAQLAGSSDPEDAPATNGSGLCA